MPLILNLETSTKMCSVALAQDGQLLSLKEHGGEYTHAENLSLFVDEVMHKAGKKMQELDAVAVSMGPGSYTGLRIGVSTAKGFCYALDKPLIGIRTLDALKNAYEFPVPASALLCPMLDARRMEVYCAVYDSSGAEVEAVNAKIIEEDSFYDLLEKGPVIFFGDGAEKCKGTITHKNAHFADPVFTSAKFMIALSENACIKKQFVDTAYFEPYYLKDFVTGNKNV